MKNTIVVAISLVFTMALSAQVKPDHKDFFFYDASYISLLNTGGGVEQYGFSNGHNLTFMKEVLFGQSTTGFGYGIGYSSKNYFTNTLIQTNPANGDENYTVLDIDSAGARNKFNQKFIDLALEFRFRSKQKDNGRFFRFYVGARGGVRFAGYAEYDNNNLDVQYRDIDEFNRFHGNAYVRIGYGFVSLYGSYGLTPIFTGGTTNTGFNMEDVRPLSIGVSLSI